MFKSLSIFPVMFFKLARSVFVAAVLAVLPQVANAFALLGPKTEWMTQENGYYDVGGPMDLHEEYRWNVPVLTYGFDRSFRERFGTNAMRAVDEAMAMFNALPPMDSISDQSLTNDYGFFAALPNVEARTFELLDLKSTVVALVLKQLGLAVPEQSNWSIRAKVIAPGITNFVLLRRNFDPVSTYGTNRINEIQYTFLDIGADGPRSVPLIFSTAASFSYTLFPGFYIPRLTADDVGGLRYLYRSDNINFEVLPPQVRGVGGVPFVNAAARPGVNDLQFVPHSLDAVSGDFQTMTIAFTDRFVTNGAVREQALERVIDRPDFLFTVENLGFYESYSASGTAGWTNLAGLNGSGSSVGGAGPGIIQGQARIALSDIGPSVPGPDRQWAGFTETTLDWVLMTNRVEGSLDGKVPVQIQLFGSHFIGQSPVQVPMQLSAEFGAPLELQTSGDLVNWTRHAVIVNYNRRIVWSHDGGSTNLFFRIVAPQP